MKPTVRDTVVRIFGLRAIAVFWCVLLLASCGNRVFSPKTSESRYRDWRSTENHAAEVEAYRAYLQEQGVGDAVPMSALLRTARSWRSCGQSEFAVPPRTLWPQMLPTLRVVERLKAAGWLDPSLARSVYRDEAINDCAGGAKGSKHKANLAIDFDLPASATNVENLCAFWREHGPALNMGLGFYTPTAIHVDTAGYRTWGEDHTKRTSLCLRE